MLTEDNHALASVATSSIDYAAGCSNGSGFLPRRGGAGGWISATKSFLDFDFFGSIKRKFGSFPWPS